MSDIFMKTQGGWVNLTKPRFDYYVTYCSEENIEWTLKNAGNEGFELVSHHINHGMDLTPQHYLVFKRARYEEAENG